MNDKEIIKNAFIEHFFGLGKYKNDKELEWKWINNGDPKRPRAIHLTIEFIDNSPRFCIMREYVGEKLWHKIYYKDGQKHGRVIEYKENGKIDIEFLFENGKEIKVILRE